MLLMLPHCCEPCLTADTAKLEDDIRETELHARNVLARKIYPLATKQDEKSHGI